jgi:hypothetical protein
MMTAAVRELCLPEDSLHKFDATILKNPAFSVSVLVVNGLLLNPWAAR